MASSSRENSGRGSWEIKSEPKNSTTNGQTREKLTLHVKKRQSVDNRARLESPPAEVAVATSKKNKKAKKGCKSKAKSSTPTRRQLKDESTGSEDATGETPDPEDSTSPNQVDEVALQQARQDFINNAILKEILNEKKRVCSPSN